MEINIVRIVFKSKKYVYKYLSYNFKMKGLTLSEFQMIKILYSLLCTFFYLELSIQISLILIEPAPNSARILFNWSNLFLISSTIVFILFA